MRIWRNGSRARLRIWWSNPWGFESLHPHFFFFTNLYQVNITTENLNDNHLKVKINLDPQDYLPKVEESIKTVSKKIAMPGFRPGHVPVGLAKKMHGNEVLADELNKLLSESLETYIKDNNLNVFGEPLTFYC